MSNVSQLQERLAKEGYGPPEYTFDIDNTYGQPRFRAAVSHPQHVLPAQYGEYAATKKAAKESAARRGNFLLETMAFGASVSSAHSSAPSAASTTSYVTELQEHLAKAGLPPPNYICEDRTEPQILFRFRVNHPRIGDVHGGWAASKKVAKDSAAEAGLGVYLEALGMKYEVPQPSRGVRQPVASSVHSSEHSSPSAREVVGKFSKNFLQEYCMKQRIATPEYSHIETRGPPHLSEHRCSVSVNGQWFESGWHHRKIDADQAAATKACIALHIVDASKPNVRIDEMLTQAPKMIQVDNVAKKQHTLYAIDCENSHYALDMDFGQDATVLVFYHDPETVKGTRNPALQLVQSPFAGKDAVDMFLVVYVTRYLDRVRGTNREPTSVVILSQDKSLQQAARAISSFEKDIALHYCHDLNEVQEPLARMSPRGFVSLDLK